MNEIEKQKAGKVEAMWIPGIIRFILQVVWHLGLIAIVVYVITAVSGIANPYLPTKVEVEQGSLLAQDAGSPMELVSVDAKIDAISFGLGMKLLFHVGMIIQLCLSLAIVFVLRRIMDTHLKTDSFRPENASRIRLIGWFLIATEVVSCIYSCLTSSYVASRLNTAELTFSGTPDFESTTIFMGLICFVLAEVFQRGSKIEQEHALTI